MSELSTIYVRFGLTEQDGQEVNRLAERMSLISYMDFERAQASLLQVLTCNPQKLIEEFNKLSQEISQNSRMHTNNWRKMHGLPMRRRK